MPITPGVGAQSFVGFAPEVTAGTPVAATGYIPIMPDQTSDVYDPKRAIVEVGAGTTFAEQYVADEDGTVQITVEFPFFGTMGQQLIFLAAFKDVVTGAATPYTHTGTMTLAKPVTLEISRAGQSWQYAGCYARSVRVQTNGKAIPSCQIVFDGTVLPVMITPSTPTFSATDQPYSWRDFQTATLLAAGAGVKTIDTWEIQIDLDNQLFYGNTTGGLPSNIVPGVGSVRGTFRKLFDSTTEYTRFVTNGQAPGTLTFAFNKSANQQATFTMTNGIYLTDRREGQLRAPIVETFEYHGLAPGGANPVTYTAINGSATAYTTT